MENCDFNNYKLTRVICSVLTLGYSMLETLSIDFVRIEKC